VNNELKQQCLRGLCVVLAVVCGSVSAQDLTVRWNNDPKTQAWADTDQTVYGADWQSGLSSQIDVQSNPGDVVVVNDPVVSGNKSLSVSISRNENFANVANGAPRAELRFPAVASFAQGKDYLVRWSTYLPPGFEFDTKQFTILTQVHQSSSTGSPPIALALLGTQYTISVRGGANTAHSSAAQTLCCADADRGRWVYWALHYVPDETGQHALTELYKDGTSVFATSGTANAYLGDQTAYLKIGLYKPNWISQPSDVTQTTVLYGPVYMSQR